MAQWFPQPLNAGNFKFNQYSYFFPSWQMNQIRVQLDNESRNLAAATDDNIRLKAQVEALHSKNINLEAKASVFFVCHNSFLFEGYT